MKDTTTKGNVKKTNSYKQKQFKILTLKFDRKMLV